MVQCARADGNECLIYSEMKSTPCDILCLEHKMNETKRNKEEKEGNHAEKQKIHSRAQKNPSAAVTVCSADSKNEKQ
jgi:hypothetical protein